MVEAFRVLQTDLEAERRAYQKHWARREKQIQQLVLSTAGLYGGLQGIVGASALPDLPVLQLEMGEPQP